MRSPRSLWMAVLLALGAAIYGWQALSRASGPAGSDGRSPSAATEPETPAVAAKGAAPAKLAKPASMAVAARSRLPAEAQKTLRLLEKGGPFPFAQDGKEFQNRERRLPQQRRGYYREYTVITPSSGDRGARRIVCGAQGELYYTDDHYATFRWIE